jgi:hypothetical protein
MVVACWLDSGVAGRELASKTATPGPEKAPVIEPDGLPPADARVVLQRPSRRDAAGS